MQRAERPLAAMARERFPLPRAALSVAALVALWALAAVVSADPAVLPTPWAVAAIVVEEARSGELFHHVGATLLRVAAAFALAMVIGCLVGIALGQLPAVDRWADPIVLIFLNLPALVVIVLCYLWIGLNEVAAIAAVSINKTAMVIVTMREGARTLSKPIAEMAAIYRLTPWQRLAHAVMPQLGPFLSASARNGLAIIWKIVLVAEFLGRGNGVGFQIHLYFQLFETGMVLAYALTFVAVMLLIEMAVLKPAERSTARWRAAAA